MPSDTWDGVGGGGPATIWTQADLWVGGTVPVDTNTATFNGGEPALPDTNLPAAGTIGFTFTGAYSPLTVTSLLGGAAIGLITVNNAAAVITPGANFAGATITAGQLTIAANRTSSQAISVTGTLYINNATLAMAAGMNVAPQGTGTVQAAGAAPILDGDFLAAGNCTVDWASTLDIIGSFDAGGFAVTHSNINAVAGINQITCDLVGNLDLGSTHADLQRVIIAVSADTTATSTVTAWSWNHTLGTYTDGGQDHNIVTHINDAGGALISTGTWTMTGSGNVTGGLFNELVLAQPTFTSTLTGTVTAKEVRLGTGTVTGAQNMTVFAYSDYWTQDAGNTIDITKLQFNLQAAVVVLTAIDTSGGSTLLRFQGDNRTATMSGAINAGSNNIEVYASGAGNLCTLDLATNAQALTAGNVAIGDAGTTKAGRVDLGATSTITGAITGGATSKATNVITMPAGSVHNWSGSINGTNIDTITAGAGVVIEGGGTISACDGDPGNIVRCLGMVDGGGNHANYAFSSVRGARQTLIGAG